MTEWTNKQIFPYSLSPFPFFFVPLHPESSVPVCRWCPGGHERKVRAAQDTPLVKVPAVGDGWIWEKRMTAPVFFSADFRNKVLDTGKGEKAV